MTERRTSYHAGEEPEWYGCPCTIQMSGERDCNADLRIRAKVAAARMEQEPNEPRHRRIQCPVCLSYVLVIQPEYKRQLARARLVPERGGG